MATNTTIQIKKSSTQFVVKNILHSIEFYTTKLGFQLEFLYENFYAGIIKDGCSIHLKSGTPLTNERNIKREHNDLDMIFSVSHVDALFEELTGKAIDIVQPLCEQPYGREFYIADPDGYILAFLEEH